MQRGPPAGQPVVCSDRKHTIEILGLLRLRSGSLRLYAADPEKLVAEWKKQWPFPDLRWVGHRWVEPDMEDVFTAYSQGYDAVLKPAQS